MKEILNSNTAIIADTPADTPVPTVTVTTTSPPKTNPNLPTQTITEVYTANHDSNDTSQEEWYRKTWRPMMAFLYAAICAFDFIIAPTFMMIFFPLLKIPYSAWVPLTLQNGGLIHLSFGAILGIYAWGRNQESLKKIPEA